MWLWTGSLLFIMTIALMLNNVIILPLLKLQVASSQLYPSLFAFLVIFLFAIKFYRNQRRKSSTISSPLSSLKGFLKLTSAVVFILVTMTALLLLNSYLFST